MLDFRKQFQEIIEQSYIPFNIDKAATSDVWSNIMGGRFRCTKEYSRSSTVRFGNATS